MVERLGKVEDEAVRADAVSLFLTGMNPKEYYIDGWTVHADRVVIHGQKTNTRERPVPLVQAPTPPHFDRPLLLYKAVKDLFTPYSLRRSYARMLEIDARIPRTRRKCYIGHDRLDELDGYEAHEVAAYLVEDAQRIREVLKPFPNIFPNGKRENA